MLRKHGVVGKFVEYFGDGLDDLPLADRAGIRLVEGDHNIDCRIEGIGAMQLKSEFVRKA